VDFKSESFVVVGSVFVFQLLPDGDFEDESSSESFVVVGSVFVFQLLPDGDFEDESSIATLSS